MAQINNTTTKPPQRQGPTATTLPSRDNMNIDYSFLTGSGSGFGLSPGPMTLVSTFFSDDNELGSNNNNFNSFSNLLASSSSPRLPVSEPGPGRVGFKENKPPGLVISQPGLFITQPGLFMISPGVSPAVLLDSPGLFPSQGPFGMSHQQALAQVTAQAVQAQALQGFQSSVASCISTSEPFSAFTAELALQDNVTSSELESKETAEAVQFSGSDQRSQFSSVIVDKPANDGYNWRKYGQKQVKGGEFPRSYYKCTHAGCAVKKKVERSLDGQVTEIIYKGQHNHQPPPKKSKDIRNLNENSVTRGNLECVSQPQANNFNSANEGMAYSLPRRDQESSQATAEHFSSDDEEVGNEGTRESGVDDDEPDAKRRNTEVRVTEQPASHRTVAEPRIVVQTTSEVDLLDDGYKWRKYGQKVVKGNPYPRSYYKCTHPGCNVRKHVERAASDSKAVVTTYEGKHNHDVPAGRMSSHNTTNNNSSSQLRSHKTDFTYTRQQPAALLRLKEERIT